MKKIDATNLPIRFPLGSLLGFFAFLRAYNYPEWAYGIGYTLIVIFLFAVIHSKLTDTETNIFDEK